MFLGGQGAAREVYLDMKHGVEAKNYADVSSCSVMASPPIIDPACLHYMIGSNSFWSLPGSGAKRGQESKIISPEVLLPWSHMHRLLCGRSV